MSNIFKRLKEFRESKGFSEEDLANALHTKQQNIHRYEDGTKIPNTLLEEFARVYPHKIMWLLTGKEEIENPKNENNVPENENPPQSIIFLQRE